MAYQNQKLFMASKASMGSVGSGGRAKQASDMLRSRSIDEKQSIDEMIDELLTVKGSDDKQVKLSVTSLGPSISPGNVSSHSDRLLMYRKTTFAPTHVQNILLETEIINNKFLTEVI